MRERSLTTPRRRGPKHPLPRTAYDEEHYDASESPYYTIDNTEDIYGTTLLPSQRCYVDPWDLENYDYVRKKVASTPPSPNVGHYYESSLSPSPPGEPLEDKNFSYYRSTTPPRKMAPTPPRMAATMPRQLRRSTHIQCDMPCCGPAPRHRAYDDMRQSVYGSSGASAASGIGVGVGVGGRYNKYDDYMTHMTEDMMMVSLNDDIDQNIYNGYGGFSSSSSTERHSSIGEDYVASRIAAAPLNIRKRSTALQSKPAPHIDFPPPPPPAPAAASASSSGAPLTYDYCNPYATLPYCSVSDCYECLSQAQASSSLIYAAPSTLYGSSTYYGASTLGRRRPSSSLYAGIYANKFGLSKKGLLQIDYSCSWNDLDRVMGRHY